MNEVDVIGIALLDFFTSGNAPDISTETNISEADEMPVAHFFRDYNEMPLLEKKSLQLCKGRVLDVGCGAGSHSLYLQNKGFDVTAIDISKGAIDVARKRGVKDARQIHLLELQEEKFDTILLLMNGTGIFETLQKAPLYLHHLKLLLNDGGSILIDSSDLAFMYDAEENGAIWVPADRYYGELTFTMTYKGVTSASFDWLYIDQKKFETLCKQNGFKFNVVKEGSHFDYLAKLSIGADSPSL